MTDNPKNQLPDELQEYVESLDRSGHQRGRMILQLVGTLQANPDLGARAVNQAGEPTLRLIDLALMELATALAESYQRIASLEDQIRVQDNENEARFKTLESRIDKLFQENTKRVEELTEISVNAIPGILRTLCAIRDAAGWAEGRGQLATMIVRAIPR